jgi:glycosyltransferase involved in cell wall biosynthesis
MVPQRLNIASVCRTLPNPDDPSGGIFVFNRVAAMAERAALHAIQPLPWFPGLRSLPSWGREPSRRQDGLEIEHAPMFYLPGLFKSLDALWLRRAIQARVRRMHARQPLDLIDAHFGYPEGAGCVTLGASIGVPVFVTVRGFETEYVHAPGVGARMIGALQKAAGIVAVSHSLARLMEKIGVEAARVRVVHNAIDGAVYSFAEPAGARTRLGLAPAGPLVVSVGHLIRRKRHHVLLDAFARIADLCPGAELAVIGGESFEPGTAQSLQRRARELGLANRVRFTGNLPPATVADWLRAADVFALATAREGCCNAVLEALASGAPVVTTPVGDNAQFVVPGVNGALVPVDDAAAMADAIMRAVQASAWDRRAIAARLHGQVGDWSQVAGRVLEFFAERLAAGAAGDLAAVAVR